MNRKSVVKRLRRELIRWIGYVEEVQEVTDAHGSVNIADGLACADRQWSQLPLLQAPPRCDARLDKRKDLSQRQKPALNLHLKKRIYILIFLSSLE